jgi:DNA-binding response OmpR family regulator
MTGSRITIYNHRQSEFNEGPHQPKTRRCGPESAARAMADSPKRVLLVDDDADIVEPVRFALQEHGYEVLVASDGSEALMRVERDAPDLILLDVIMPKRSGFSVLERLSRRAGHIPPVIMMSGSAESRHRDYAESQGVSQFLSKPFEMTELLERVDSLLMTGTA